MTISAQADFDVIIVGGGIAGTALALALAKTSLRIALLEAGSPVNEVVNQIDDAASVDVYAFDTRVSALTEKSRQFFEQLGAWSLMCQQRVSAYKKMTVWDADGTAEMNFDCREVATSWLGHIVENRVIVQSLLQQLKKFPAITLRHNVRVKQLQMQDQLHALVLQDDSVLTASLIVAADGANSFLRDAADFSVRQWDYGHKAIVCTVQTELLHQQTAWQRFMPQGPLAFLPLHSSEVDAKNNQQYCSIVWSAVPELADELMALDEEIFCLRLERAFESRLGKVIRVGTRQCFPLQQRHAIDYCKSGIALIADAAHTVHPLAGQGINLGLKDVQVLAEEISRAVQRGIAVGSLDVLSRYQRRRKANNLSTMAAMEGFKQLFARDELPLRWLRNTGMRFFNRQPLIKRALIRQAMDV
jgi:2-octaprenylphenol hydroxylase